MPAFNKRFTPPEAAGIPLIPMIAIVCAFMSLMLILLFPILVFDLIGAIGLTASVAGFIFGSRYADDMHLVPTYIKNKILKNSKDIGIP